MSGLVRFVAAAVGLASAAMAAEVSPDRMVAEWALRMGGRVVLEGQKQPIEELAALPDTDFRIHTLDLVAVTFWAYGLRDEVSRLPALPHLKELYVNGRIWYGQPVAVVGEYLSLWAGSPALEKLIFSKPVQTYIPLEDPALKSLQSLPNLEELRLHQTRTPGEALAPFTKLKHLDLSYNSFFNDKGMARVGAMKQLTRLYLRATSVTDAGLKNLAGLTELNELVLAGLNISDAGVQSLAGLTKLRRLDLQGANLSGADLTGANLKAAHLDQADLTGAYLYGANLSLAGPGVRQTLLPNTAKAYYCHTTMSDGSTNDRDCAQAGDTTAHTGGSGSGSSDAGAATTVQPKPPLLRDQSHH